MLSFESSMSFVVKLFMKVTLFTQNLLPPILDIVCRYKLANDSKQIRATHKFPVACELICTLQGC